MNRKNTSDSFSDASEIDSGLLFGYGFFRGGLSFLEILLLVLEAMGDGRFDDVLFTARTRLLLASSDDSSVTTEILEDKH